MPLGDFRAGLLYIAITITIIRFGIMPSIAGLGYSGQCPASICITGFS